jgi:hypothetical protein
VKKKSEMIEIIRSQIKGEIFINNHKGDPRDFTRKRVFDFPLVFILLLQKSVKSLQLVLNELFVGNYIKNPVTSSAYSQMRKKFKHTAFIELNEASIALYYRDNEIKRWKGYRVFGVDASNIILPASRAIKEEFGSVPIKNQHVESGEYSNALFECRYDVLNRMAVQSSLHPGSSYEVDLAIDLLHQSGGEWTHRPDDLDIYDRGYASYEFMANLVHCKREFVIRCSSSSFKATQSLFAGEGDWSKAVTLDAPKDIQKRVREAGLPTEIKVRFISVVLDTGEIEVLATSLMSPDIQRDEFKALYFFRWGVEGFFNLLKGRLNLENFTGKSVESVKQDFWSTLFISNVETIFTEDIQQDLNSDLKENQLPKKVNKAVSFNAIKNMAFELFFSEKDRDRTEEKLTQLFRMNTLVQRNGRSPPRQKHSPQKTINYQKRSRKHVF